MQKTIIYQVSQGSHFPLIFEEQENSSMKNVALDVPGLLQLNVDPEDLHVFLIHCAEGQVAPMLDDLKQAAALQTSPRIMILAAGDYKEFRSRLALLPRTYVLDDAIRPGHLRLMVALVVRAEKYKQTVRALSQESREQNKAFESLLEMARLEKHTMSEESRAYQGLLAFQDRLRKSEVETEKAMQEAIHLKNQELLALKEQLEMVERLSEFRDRELATAQRNFKAAEIALDMSHQENLEREKIISALDTLRQYTDNELLELFNENQQLRKKLGLPER